MHASLIIGEQFFEEPLRINNKGELFVAAARVSNFSCATTDVTYESMFKAFIFASSPPEAEPRAQYDKMVRSLFSASFDEMMLRSCFKVTSPPVDGAMNPESRGADGL